MLVVDANVWIAAFDPHDRFHRDSVEFLRAVARHEVQLAAPAFLLVEAACALARRSGDEATGRIAFERLQQYPQLTFHPVDQQLLARAIQHGVQSLVRGADALYVATARTMKARLVSWDNELLHRAQAVTPEQWLAELNGQ